MSSCLFLSSYLSWRLHSLYGMTILQTFLFFRTSGKDGMSLRIMVRPSHMDVLTRHSNRLPYRSFAYCTFHLLDHQVMGLTQNLACWTHYNWPSWRMPFIIILSQISTIHQPSHMQHGTCLPSPRTSSTHFCCPGVLWYLHMHVLHNRLFIPIILQGHLLVTVSFVG